MVPVSRAKGGAAPQRTRPFAAWCRPCEQTAGCVQKSRTKNIKKTGCGGSKRAIAQMKNPDVPDDALKIVSEMRLGSFCQICLRRYWVRSAKIVFHRPRPHYLSVLFDTVHL
jgi:hypothetical protein